MGNVVRWPVLLSEADVTKTLVTCIPDLRGFLQTARPLSLAAANTPITGKITALGLEYVMKVDKKQYRPETSEQMESKSQFAAVRLVKVCPATENIARVLLRVKNSEMKG